MNSLTMVNPDTALNLSRPQRPGTVTQAVIMAGGKGTRLHPYSALFPKPLMPLGDMPVLELLLRQMAKAGITDVVIAVNHLRHLIEAFFGNGSQFGLRIRYSTEDRPLGTAGALGNMIDDLDHTFMVSNGDLLTSMDLAAMGRRPRHEEGAEHWRSHIVFHHDDRAQRRR